jgi:Uncharacterized conserved protein
MEEVKLNPDQVGETDIIDGRFLILYNDDVNTFDYVIDSLIEVCGHEPEQAAQCAMITHFKGKCDVKKGSFDYLRPMKQELINRNLSATIN